MIQVIECLPNKLQALSSTPTTANKQEEIEGYYIDAGVSHKAQRTGEDKMTQRLKRLELPQAKMGNVAWQWWLRPVILATQEAEIRRIMVLSQPGQTVLETLF
jgi:hypothetical protein